MLFGARWHRELYGINGKPTTVALLMSAKRIQDKTIFDN